MFNLRSRQGKLAHQRQMVRQMERQERHFRSVLAALIRKQYLNAARVVKHGVHDTLAATEGEREDLIHAYWSVYKRSGEDGLRLVREGIPVVGLGVSKAAQTSGLSIAGGTGYGPRGSMADTFWSDFSTFTRLVSGQRVTAVQETTRRRIARIIRDGVQAGDGPEDIARTIDQLSEIDSHLRARRIARTEVHMAMNFATLCAVRSTGLRVSKEWACMLDERTRTDHRKANGQRVGQTEDFIIGGERMGYPGDPRGSAKEVINCRCVLLYHTSQWPGGSPMVDRRGR